MLPGCNAIMPIVSGAEWKLLRIAITDKCDVFFCCRPKVLLLSELSNRIICGSCKMLRCLYYADACVQNGWGVVVRQFQSNRLHIGMTCIWISIKNQITQPKNSNTKIVLLFYAHRFPFPAYALFRCHFKQFQITFAYLWCEATKRGSTTLV